MHLGKWRRTRALRGRFLCAASDHAKTSELPEPSDVLQAKTT